LLWFHEASTIRSLKGTWEADNDIPPAKPLAGNRAFHPQPARLIERISAVRPTNKTNMAAKSEAEKSRETLRRFEGESDKEEKGRAVVAPTLDHGRDRAIF
jgi:hypothetical protein